MIYLARDPRGTLNSRKVHAWCNSKNKDCSDPRLVCSDLSDDFDTAVRFQKQYPNKFR